MVEKEMKRMTVKASEDVYVALTTGDAVRLTAGEEREFPEYIGYACLQAGAVEVKDEPKAKTMEDVIEETEEKPKTKVKTTKKK